MLIKDRDLSIEMQVLRVLRGRISFSSQMDRQLWILNTGHVGELQFDALGKSVDDFVVRLNDLVLVVDGKLCQLDAIYICGGIIHLFEVKNWRGTFDLVEGNFTGVSACPLGQLKSSRLLLEEWLRLNRIKARVEARLVFIGAHISLYGLQRENPILLAHQIPGYLENMRQLSPGFVQNGDIQLGQQLVQCHVVDNPYRQKVTYHTAEVGTGLFCGECRNKMAVANARMLICKKCGIREFKKVGLQRAIRELDVLFPPEPQRVNQIYKWCDELISKRLIHQQLRK